jgi:hypothetical protein
MSVSVPVIIPPAPTVTQVKLAKLVAESNPSAVAKRARSTSNTIRLIIAGAVAPTSRTIERFRVLDIQPEDWFRKAQPEVLKVTGEPGPIASADVPGVESL